MLEWIKVYNSTLCFQETSVKLNHMDRLKIKDGKRYSVQTPIKIRLEVAILATTWIRCCNNVASNRVKSKNKYQRLRDRI